MSNVRNALERAVWLYERYGLIAGTIEGDPMAAGKWINAAREALAQSEATDIRKALEALVKAWDAMLLPYRAERQLAEEALAQPQAAQPEAVAWNFTSFEEWWDAHGFYNAIDGSKSLIDAKSLVKLAWDVAREHATPPQPAPQAEPATVGELPPLPEPEFHQAVVSLGTGGMYRDGFSADQMRNYARAAIASAPKARRPLDEASRMKAFHFLGQQKLDDGTPFCDAYTAANLTFTPADIEYVREANGELRIGFWRGNSNLYWPVRPEEWESLPAAGGKS